MGWKLTKAGLPAVRQHFAASDKADKIYFDQDLPGFGIRLRAGSRREVWCVQYERMGVARRLTLGTGAILDPDQARKKAKEELAKVTLGGDPQAKRDEERAKAKILLRGIIDRYLDSSKSKLRPNSFEQTERYLLNSWKPLHGFPIHRIERKHVAIRLGELERQHSVAAARARSALSALFSWAIAQGIVDSNPVMGTAKPKDAMPRDRVLTDAELAQVWDACRDDDYSRVVKLLILTGQRRDEVGAMTQAELNRDTGQWLIPANRTKNARPHLLSLPQAAWAIIDTVPRQKEYLFGRGQGGFAGWTTGKLALDERLDIAPWVVHDLRRTVATGLANLGVLPHVIEALLNHVSGHKRGPAGVYNRSTYERETRNALALWAEHIHAITTGTERKVLQFPA
jgi:integrase